MDSITSMKNKLIPLGLYNLEINSKISAELSAYSVAFNMINQKLEELERECFINTSQTYGLELREKLFDYVRTGLDLYKRRTMLIYRTSITSNDFNKSKITEALMSSGMEVEITENLGSSEIEVNCISFFDTISTQIQAQKKAQEFIPAHIASTFTFNN